MIGPPKTALEALLEEKRRRVALKLSEQQLLERLKDVLKQHFDFTLSRRHVVTVKTAVELALDKVPGIRKIKAPDRGKQGNQTYALIKRTAEELGATIVRRGSLFLIRGAKTAGMSDEEAVEVSKFIRKNADPWELTRDLKKFPKNRKRDAQKVTKKA
jgi:hypothetical protein